MRIFKREIEKAITAYLQSEEIKTLLVWGPRRSGKTTLINKLAKKLKVAKYNFDLASDRDKFAPRREVLERITKENKVVLIDEIQNYPEATVILKLLHDETSSHLLSAGAHTSRS